MKVGDKVRCIGDEDGGAGWELGLEFTITSIDNCGKGVICFGGKNGNGVWAEYLELTTEDQHYDNTNGSLYKFAVDHGLNAYEFDIVKRIVRCRKKGQFVEDLEKTKRVIDLYLKENGSTH